MSEYCNGITPAYAGKTTIVCIVFLHFRDHPRLRGENKCLKLIWKQVKGSPPPTRGKPVNCLAVPVVNRITPAYAGKTVFIYCVGCFSQDHPRLRGENVMRLWAWLLRQGSPPPTRGKPVSFLDPQGEAGITPAYAGKTAQATAKLLITEDHPRLRGENGGLFVGWRQ